MKCRQLRETGQKQNRWLSMPESRLVINPFCYNLPGNVYPSQYSNRPYIPLNIGYLPPEVPKSGVGLFYPDLLMVHKETNGESELLEAAQVDLTDSSRWTKSELDIPYDCEADFDASGISITVKEGALKYWQYVTTVVEVDLDKTPMLQLEIPECRSAWGVKVAPEDTMCPEDDIVLMTENSATGVFAENIAKVTGWSGLKRFKLRLYAYGFGRTVKYSGIRIEGVRHAAEEAARHQTEWMPHELPFMAEYPDGTVLKGFDTFWDLKSVCRVVNVKEKGGIETVILGGRYQGKLYFDESRNLITVSSPTGSYKIRVFGLKVSDISYYATFCQYLSGKQGAAEPMAMGYWRIKGKIPASETQRFYAIVSFDSSGESDVTYEEIERKRRDNETFWDSYFEKVPKIGQISFEWIESKGITVEMVAKQYYIAWAFLRANILPRSPETGYNFIQMACGKPSLWGAGAPEAPYTASWESLVAMQLYSEIDPIASWEAFQGLMSLVDENGMLAGESLPSKKAQTAYILYNATEDKKALGEVYPSIKQYMLWRVDNPRWILGEVNDPNDRDADFVVSALIDILYLMDIAEILGLKEEKVLWQETYDRLYSNYKSWFWEEPAGQPYQHYDIASGARRAGHVSWILTGIYLPGLEKEYRDSLMSRFLEELDIQQPFGSLSMPKYPEITFDIWGLMNKGYPELADTLIELCIRDITQANFFSEQYDEKEFPYPTGVRPSVFGCALLVECVLMKSGRILKTMRNYKL